MKKVVWLFLSGVLVSSSLFAQEEEGSAKANYGATKEDSVVCVQSLSLYSEFFKQGNYKDALKGWRKAVKVCPASSKNLYVRGAKMYSDLIDAEKDETIKAKLVDTLFSIYDKRIENFGEKGYVLERKGTDMAKYRKDDIEATYQTLNEAFKLQGDEMGAAAIAYLYIAQYNLYAKKKATKEEVIALYPTLMGVIDKNLKNPEKEKSKSAYEKTAENLDKYFSKVADCPDLIAIYKPKFEANKKDVEGMKQMLKIFEKRNCTEESLYMEIAIALNEIEPSAEASYGIGVGMMKKEKYGEATGFFQKAAELTQDNGQKLNAYLNMAKSYLASKQYASAKSAALKALSVDANSGEAYIIIGDAYAYGGKECGENDCAKKAGYWAAYEKYAKAKAVDSSVAEKANSKMASAKSQYPKQEDCFFYSMKTGDSYTIGCWINETVTVQVQ